MDPSAQLCQKLLTIFETEIPLLIRDLEDSLSCKDLKKSAKIIHSIKSSCLNIGAKEMSAMATQLEANLSLGNESDKNFVIVFKNCFKYSVQSYKTHLSNYIKNTRK